MNTPIIERREPLINCYNHKGQPMEAVYPAKGFYKHEAHFYHCHSNGITHIHINIINHLERISLAPDEALTPISEEIFEQEVRNAVFNIGIYKYVKSA